jgi:DNA-binding NarL/FixJ family response regulator
LAINILVVDDHAVVRAGLRSLIQSDKALRMAGEAAGGLEAINIVEKCQPDVVVLDLSMPDVDGITVTKDIHTKYPGIKILILTVHEDEALLREAIRAGASGYILKHAAETELVEAIKQVVKGDMFIDTKMLPSLFKNEKRTRKETTPVNEKLTPREIDVLKLLVEGYTNKQIGQELNISVRTVEGHRANIYRKLDLRTRVELVRYAKSQKLI